MKKQFISSVKLFLFFTILLGFAYPLASTLIAQSFFAEKANGSLIYKDKIIIGSELLSQKTTQNHYFWPRPSASDYGAVPSGASNLSLTSKKLQDSIRDRASQGFSHDLLFSSASGLDPHITKDAANSQISRIAESRNLNENQQKQLLELLEKAIEKRQFGFLGEERINVLKLNLELDNLFIK
jgi:potassium-transporting ATPase KdpC subunit